MTVNLWCNNSPLHTDPMNTFEADCTDGEIRLTDGSNALEGRVEICFNRAWGTVCDTGFGNDEAEVICTQLSNKMGYAYTHSIPFRGAVFGDGRGPIFLESLGCSGTESMLSGCSLGSPVGVHTCEHSQDAGVKCTGEFIIMPQSMLSKIYIT